MSNRAVPFRRYEDDRFVIDFEQGNIWRKRQNRYDLVRKTNEQGYYRFKHDNRLILAHRLIMSKWLGRELEPDEYIDHIDSQRANNAIANLRIVDKTGNNQHVSRAYKTSKSGLLGVCFEKARGKWIAGVGTGDDKFIGRFDTKEEAAAARNDRVAELNRAGNMYSYTVLGV